MLQSAHFFASETPRWLQQNADQLTNVTDSLEAYCGRVQCDATVPEATGTLNDIEANLLAIQTSLSEQQISLCPSTACINLELLWFLDESGCVCEPAAIEVVIAEAKKGVPAWSFIDGHRYFAMCGHTWYQPVRHECTLQHRRALFHPSR